MRHNLPNVEGPWTHGPLFIIILIVYLIYIRSLFMLISFVINRYDDDNHLEEMIEEEG